MEIKKKEKSGFIDKKKYGLYCIVVYTLYSDASDVCNWKAPKDLI